MGALERAREDVEAGRLWKARDRLEGTLGTDPHDQDVLALLAGVCIRMGDLPAAGKYLYLTESWDADGGAGRNALEGRYGRGPVNLLRVLPAKPPLESYPPAVATRLGRLIAEAREEGYVWRHAAESPAPGQPVQLLGWKARAVLAVVALLTVGIWALGVVFLVQLVL